MLRQRTNAQLDRLQFVEMLDQLVCGDADEAGREATLWYEHLIGAFGYFPDRLGNLDVLGQVEVVRSGSPRAIPRTSGGRSWSSAWKALATSRRRRSLK